MKNEKLGSNYEHLQVWCAITNHSLIVWDDISMNEGEISKNEMNEDEKFERSKTLPSS